MTRRVLLVANTLPPRDVSGVGEQVLQLAAGLRAAGCEVEVLGRGPGQVGGPKVLFPFFAVPAVRRALRRFRPHAVQVHESDGGLAALLVKRLAPRLDPRPRLVALLQVSYVEERRAVRPLRAAGRDGCVLGRPGGVERRFRWLKAPLQIFLGRLTARAADLVLAPSAATAAELRRDYGVEDIADIAVVPNVTGGLDVQAVESGEAPGFLLFVGRLRIRKGVEVLLEALRDLRSARLLIAGDGEHRDALEAKVAALGLGGSVRFLGRCDAGRVRGLLRDAAALVVPSTYEGMPLVVLEAMESGIPVIASRVSGIPEVVEDGVTGWLVPPEDPGALAAALGEALGGPDEAQRRGAAGRRRVDERFRPRHAAAAWLRAVFADVADVADVGDGEDEMADGDGKDSGGAGFMMGRALLVIGAMATLGLIATAVMGYMLTGLKGPEMSRHVLVALASCLLLLFSHCWIMFYLIGTGKAIKDTVNEHSLEPDLIEETKRFKNRSYPSLMLAMGLAMAAFILGGGAATGVLPVWIHHGLFWAALVAQVRSLWIEKQVLEANERLMTGIDRRLAA